MNFLLLLPIFACVTCCVLAAAIFGRGAPHRAGRLGAALYELNASGLTPASGVYLGLYYAYGAVGEKALRGLLRLGRREAHSAARGRDLEF